MRIVLIRPTTGARRATRRTALAAALLLASFTLAVSVTQQADATTSCLDGGGIDGDPFLVATEADLRKVGSGVDGCTLGAHYLQTQNITLTGSFTSIGRDLSNPANPTSFAGVYDGGGKSIIGMEINEADLNVQNVGFVARASSSATLKNIVLVNPKIQGRDFVGGLVGENSGEIRNVVLVGADIESTQDAVGGVTGWHRAGVMSGVHFTGAVTAGTFSEASYAGGLAGFGGADIVNSSASGSVDGDGKYVGGLVGNQFAGQIRASHSSAGVIGTEGIGGLIGLQDGGTVANTFSIGEVSGMDKVGGLIGLQDAGTVTNTFSTGLVAGSSNDGGLVGEQSGGTIEASFWDLTTSGLVASAGGAGVEGKSTAEMTSFATFGAAWNSGSSVIVAGWQVPSNPTWGICAGVNGGYPFLLWQFDSDPCSTTLTTPTTVASTPVLAGGVAPEVPAGRGVWQQADGTSTPLVVSRPAAGLLRYEADGVRVTLTGTAASSPARGLVADPAGEIVCEVCVAASAGQVIEVWMFSTPRLVAAHRVDDTECHLFAIPLSAPLDGGGPVSAGAHTLQFAIPTSSGMQAVNVGVTVGGPVPASVPAGEGSVPFGAVLLALLAAAGAVVAGRRLVTSG